MRDENFSCGSAHAAFEAVLEQVRAGNIPEDGERLLRESRQLKRAEDSRDLWLYLPFRMVCETLYGKKEGYHEILGQFRQIRERDYDRMFWGTCSGEEKDAREMAYFLAACVDTLEFTSMEIYEQYRYLADLIKTAARSLAENCWRTGGAGRMDRETAGMFGRSVLKACGLGALSREKYEADGLALLEHSRTQTPEGEKHKTK